MHRTGLDCAMLLTVSNLEKSFPTEEGLLTVLRVVNLTLDSGQHMALTGESGSGKSTLLYLIGALETFNSGEITIDGISLSGLGDRARADLRRHQIGIIFQQFNLVPSMSVHDNIRFHARLAGREDPAWTQQLVQALGLQDFLKAYPERLSGGQQQRVAIGRTLAARPKLVLADEPTGNLDETTSDAVIALMLELVKDTGAGLLLVTHSQRLAKRMGHHLHLSGGNLS